MVISSVFRLASGFDTANIVRKIISIFLPLAIFLGLWLCTSIFHSCPLDNRLPEIFSVWESRRAVWGSDLYLNRGRNLLVICSLGGCVFCSYWALQNSSCESVPGVFTSLPDIRGVITITTNFSPAWFIPGLRVIWILFHLEMQPYLFAAFSLLIGIHPPGLS